MMRGNEIPDKAGTQTTGDVELQEAQEWEEQSVRQEAQEMLKVLCWVLLAGAVVLNVIAGLAWAPLAALFAILWFVATGVVGIQIAISKHTPTPHRWSRLLRVLTVAGCGLFMTSLNVVYTVIMIRIVNG